MELVTSALTAIKSLSPTELKEGGLKLSKSEVEKLIPVQVADTILAG